MNRNAGLKQTQSRSLHGLNIPLALQSDIVREPFVSGDPIASPVSLRVRRPADPTKKEEESLQGKNYLVLLSVPVL